jgi:hypothetical protein
VPIPSAMSTRTCSSAMVAILPDDREVQQIQRCDASIDLANAM